MAKTARRPQAPIDPQTFAGSFPFTSPPGGSAKTNSVSIQTTHDGMRSTSIGCVRTMVASGPIDRNDCTPTRVSLKELDWIGWSNVLYFPSKVQVYLPAEFSVFSNLGQGLER